MNERIYDLRESDSLIGELIDSIKMKRYDGILILSNDLHGVWNQIVNSGVHIGLRGANWSIVKDIPVVTINEVKIVMSPDENDPKYTFFTNGDYKNNIVTPLESYDIVDLKDSRLPSMLNRLDGKLLGWDFETRGFPLEVGFKPLGFSLVSDDYGIYIDFRYYTDYKSDDFKLIYDFIIRNQRKLITFNCKFEMSCFLNMFDEYIYPLDAMALLSCDDVHTNLKSASQMYLSVPSWDDELDYEMQLLNDYMYNHNKDAITKIFENRKRIDPNADLSEYKSIKLGYGNVWEMCYPPALAKYCILDGYYTLKLWEKVAPLYTDECIDIFHRSYYHGTYLGANPMPIRVEELNKLIDESDTVAKNSNAYVNRLYCHLLESLYGDLDYTKVLTQTEIKIIESGRAWLLADQPVKILKSIVSECYGYNDKDGYHYYKEDESIYTVQPLVDIYGKDGAREVLLSGVSPKDSRRRKVWDTLVDKLNLSKESGNVVKRFNEYFNSEFIDYLKKFSELAKSKCPVPIDKLLKYRLILNLSERDLKSIEKYKSITNFIGSLSEKSKNLYLDYVNEDQLNYILNSFNPKYPTQKSAALPKRLYWDYTKVVSKLSEPDFRDDLLGFSKGNFIKYRDWISFDYICDLIKYRSDKKKFDSMDNITLYDKNPIEVPIYINIASEQDSFKLLDLIELKYSELLNNHYNQSRRNLERAVWTPDDKIFDFSDVELEHDVTESIYPLEDESSFRRIFLDKWRGANTFPQIYATKLLKEGYYRYGREKLTLPSMDKLYYYIIQYSYIKFGVDKQLSPYLRGNKGFDTNRYKIVSRTDNYSVLDKSQKGEGFVVRFNIAEKSTKRNSSFYHTIPAHGDNSEGYCLGLTPNMMEDGKIISYFDIN